MSWDIRDHYDIDDDGNFTSVSEYEGAKDNGDIDDDGYDYNGNQYDSKGDRV